MRRWRFVPLAVLLLACGRSSGSGGEFDAGSRPSATAPVSAPVARAPAPDVPARYEGKYTSEAASIYVPDGGEWAGVKWRGDDAGEGIGTGKVSIVVDPGSGRVEGSIDGPLGDAVLDGEKIGETITATVLRKSPKDRGLTGTLIGRLDGERLDGSMRLSPGDARIIRQGTFTSTRTR